MVNVVGVFARAGSVGSLTDRRCLVSLSLFLSSLRFLHLASLPPRFISSLSLALLPFLLSFIYSLISSLSLSLCPPGSRNITRAMQKGKKK